MRFLVHKDDFPLVKNTLSTEEPFKLGAATSVNQLKYDFFTELSELGSLLQIDDSTDKADLQQLCRETDVIYAAMHGDPPDGLHCRLLRHNLGSFLVSGGFLHGWNIGTSVTNIVTSHTQHTQMTRALGTACPDLGVYTPSISEEDFFLNPDGGGYGRSGSFNITYAGRLIANKGIAQTVRALNLWPLEHARMHLIGDFETEFLIYHSNAYHTTFPSFFKREVLDRSPDLPLTMESAVPRERLREKYWQSDCFVYPSFHEDENFGLAPREAILSGIPSVVTDFCGLGNLGNASGKAIKTYPSLAGVRYSLRELAERITEIHSRNSEARNEYAKADAAFVKAECSRPQAKADLHAAVNLTLQRPIGPPPTGGWRSKERLDRWTGSPWAAFREAVEKRESQPLEGLYVDGTGYPPEGRWFSDAHFMQAIQSIYTTFPKPPEVQKNMVYRGFWRISLWSEERALVEFGFPGPRICRFQPDEWSNLISCVKLHDSVEPTLHPCSDKHLKPVQRLIDLGFVVPDKL